jgi:hypothetical protein
VSRAYGPEYRSADVQAELASRLRSRNGPPAGCGLQLALGCLWILLGAAVLAVAVLWWGLARWPHTHPLEGSGAHRPLPIGPAMERTRARLTTANADHRLTADEIDRAVDPEVPLLVTGGTSGGSADGTSGASASGTSAGSTSETPAASIVVARGPEPGSSCVTFTAYADGHVTGRASPCPARHPVTVRSDAATAPAARR